MKESNPKLQLFFYLLIVLLLFPALFTNLGLLPISGDEGTRALVSLEMEYSENLLTPTINGDFYFNKPPLYNWILLGFYKISDSHSEFIIRLPAVLSLLLFALTIFLVLYRKYGTRAAFLSTLIFITCGRILFYDSMNGYIDITFSWLVFVGFIAIFRFHKREQYLGLFLVSYFICALAFLMKGLPALLFQGFSLLAVFISGGRFKKLFSLQHVAGLLLLFAIPAGYYFLVFQQNPDTVYFSTLFDESAKRTFVEYGFLKTVLHLFTFPVEQLYHLFPWSLLLIVLFSRKVLRKIREDEFLRYLSLVFIFNIPVYWISVESYPRYIFSLYPILILLSVVAFIHFRKEIPKQASLSENLLGLSLLLLIPLSLLFPGFYEFNILSNPIRLAILGSVFVVIVLFAYYFLRSFRLEITIVSLLLFRIGFNLVALPERHVDARAVLQKQQAEKVGAISRGKGVYIAGLAACSHETSFYISKESGEILLRELGEPRKGYYYIIADENEIKENEDIVFKFETRWQNTPLRLSMIK